MSIHIQQAFFVPSVTGSILSIVHEFYWWQWAEVVGTGRGPFIEEQAQLGTKMCEDDREWANPPGLRQLITQMGHAFFGVLIGETVCAENLGLALGRERLGPKGLLGPLLKVGTTDTRMSGQMLGLGLWETLMGYLNADMSVLMVCVMNRGPTLHPNWEFRSIYNSFQAEKVLWWAGNIESTTRECDLIYFSSDAMCT